MGVAADQLTGKVRDDDRFDYDPKEIREQQIAALDERFQERKDRIKLLGLRARDAEASEVRSIRAFSHRPESLKDSQPVGDLIHDAGWIGGQYGWASRCRWICARGPWPRSMRG
jgi:hypothetical protein